MLNYQLRNKAEKVIFQLRAKIRLCTDKIVEIFSIMIQFLEGCYLTIFHEEFESPAKSLDVTMQWRFEFWTVVSESDADKSHTKFRNLFKSFHFLSLRSLRDYHTHSCIHAICRIDVTKLILSYAFATKQGGWVAFLVFPKGESSISNSIAYPVNSPAFKGRLNPPLRVMCCIVNGVLHVIECFQLIRTFSMLSGYQSFTELQYYKW